MPPLESGDPRRIGEFDLMARLGQGGMGRVYLGRSQGGRPVAVKVVHEWHARDPQFRMRFAQEVAAARRVNGLYTAQLVSADPDAPLPWMATRYIEGPSLEEAVARNGPQHPDAVLRLAAGVAEALVAIHSAGVVHRDLKPSNVIVSAEGPQVIDFGIARALDTSGLTSTGTAVGTPAYMSPEQATGQPAGPPSDVFSLGSLLHFAATGRAVFEATSAGAVLYTIAHAAPDLTRIGDARLREVIAGCLTKDPSARPTAAQVLARCGNTPGHVPQPYAPPAQPYGTSPPGYGGPGGWEAPTVQAQQPAWPPAASPVPVGPGLAGPAGPARPAHSDRRTFLVVAAAVVAVGATGTGVAAVLSNLGPGNGTGPGTADPGPTSSAPRGAARTSATVPAPTAGLATRPGPDGAARGYAIGPEGAQVTVHVYMDFLCPPCKSFHDDIDPVLRTYVDRGDVRLVYFAASIIDARSTTKYSTRAANAAVAVADLAPNAYLAFQDALFAEQPPENGPGLPDSTLVDLAVKAGADRAAVEPAITGLIYEDWVTGTTDNLNQEYQGVPTLLVQDKKFDNYSSPSAVRARVDEALGGGGGGSGGGDSGSDGGAATTA